MIVCAASSIPSQLFLNFFSVLDCYFVPFFAAIKLGQRTSSGPALSLWVELDERFVQLSLTLSRFRRVIGLLACSCCVHPSNDAIIFLDDEMFDLATTWSLAL